jgi:hypothetical protein
MVTAKVNQRSLVTWFRAPFAAPRSARLSELVSAVLLVAVVGTGLADRLKGGPARSETGFGKLRFAATRGRRGV